MTTEDIIAGAAVKADRINDLLKEGVTLPNGERLWVRTEYVRKHNRLTWAALDLQDAGEGVEVWKPLMDVAYRIVREPNCGRG